MKPRHLLIGIAAFATGFLLQFVGHTPAPSPVLHPAPGEEAIAKRFREIASIGEPGLELFFETTGRPGVVYIYRSDCTDCDKQWSAIQPLLRSTPMLVVSLDDSRRSLAQKLAATEGTLAFTPYYVPPRRMLTVRTWLRDRNCPFTGQLPFVAVTDGFGHCAAAWQAGVDSSTVLAAVKTLKDNNSSASALPIIP